MRPNDVAIVRDEKEPRLALPGVDRVVVLPKIDHHFIELSLADDGTRELRGLHIRNDFLGASREIAKLWIGRECLSSCVALAGRRIAVRLQLHLLSTTRLLDLTKSLDQVRR